MPDFAAQAVALCRRAPNAQTLTYGRETAIGPVNIVDREDRDASGAPMTARHMVALVPESTLPSLTRFATVRVGSTDYIVRDINLVEDGLLKELLLQEAVS